MSSASIDLHPSPEILGQNLENLSENEYPGRLIAIGRGAGKILIQANGLTGRSESSKDRHYVEDDFGIKVTSPTKSQEEMNAEKNAKLIYYRAMSSHAGVYIVSNGVQTTRIKDNIHSGHDLGSAAFNAGEVDDIDVSIYEPDAPNFTPRISGVIDLRESAKTPFGLTIARKADDSDAAERATWQVDDLSELPEYTGYLIHTYEGNGDPLPAFRSSPIPILFGASAKETQELLWENLHPSTRVDVVATDIMMPGANYSIASRDNAN